MNRTKLNEVIKSILKRKLLENSIDKTKSKKFADYVKKLGQEYNFNYIEVSSRYGSLPIEVVEYWVVGDTLHIGVNATPTEKLNELDSPTTQSTNNQSNRTDQPDVADQMTDPEKMQVQNSQKEQVKLTDDIRRIDGGIQKLQEPLRRKMEQLNIAKANKQKKLGIVTDKIKRITDKYSKV